MPDIPRETGHSTELEKAEKKDDVVKREALLWEKGQHIQTPSTITTETTGSGSNANDCPKEDLHPSEHPEESDPPQMSHYPSLYQSVIKIKILGDDNRKRKHEEVESTIRTNKEEHREAVEKNTPELTIEYTEKNTLTLSIEAYIEKAGKAEKPKILKKTDDLDKALKAFITKGEGTKALFLDFDGTMARFTKTPQETLAVHGFLSAVKTFLDKGYKVAIITGRPIKEETGILAALKRSGADEDLINNLDIFGSHGVEHRGPETKGKVQIREDIKTYIKPQEGLLNRLQYLIKEDKVLKDLDISFEPKAVGATIHYRTVDEAKHDDVKSRLKDLLSKVLPKKSHNQNFDLLEDKSNEDFQKFMYNPSAMAFEIHLNPGTTSIEAHKGASVKYLVEKWQVQHAIAFGDERTDLDKLDALKELVANDASSLKTQAFVGTKHDKTPKRIETDATIVVEGQESAVGLLLNMAQQAEKQN